MSFSIDPNISLPPAEDEYVPAPTSPITASSFVLNTSLILSPFTVAASAIVEPNTDSAERRKRGSQEDLIEMPPPAKRPEETDQAYLEPT